MAPQPFVKLERELHEEACRRTGLEDFGDPGYRTGLRVLLAALDHDPSLTEQGWAFAYGTVLSTLVARLHAQRGWAEHPEVLGRAVRRPLVITGLPRTGTTALHKLLALDPQFQGLEHWLTETPMIRPPRESWDANPAYLGSVQALEAYFCIMPDMRKAHDRVAGEVDECLEVLRQSFVSNRFGAGTYLPSYDRWFFGQSEEESYRRYGDVLRLIGAAEPERRWLLKNPGHVAQIDALLAIFPDACIVQTHRDPVKAIPSLCSTLHMARRMYEGNAARTDVIAPRECAYWSVALERLQGARESRPQQFFDVEHAHFHVEPLSTVRSIYQHFGLSLTADTEARMRGWIASSPTTKHGEHQYGVEIYGFTEAQIRDAFMEYRQARGYESAGSGTDLMRGG